MNHGVDFAAWTDAGDYLNENEDYLIADPESGMFLVADGMGGRPGGKRASEMAGETFRALVLSPLKSGNMSDELFAEAVSASNKVLFDLSESDGSLKGFGTTLSVAILNGGRIKTVHVGDSRIYRYAGGSLDRLTRDHTIGAELVRRNYITEDEAKVHPMRNMLSRAVGVREKTEVDLAEVELRPGDVFLLCSDGLVDALSEAEIAAALAGAEGVPAQEIARCLGQSALSKKPKDNVSFIVIRNAPPV